MDSYALGSILGGSIVFVLGYLLGRRHATQACVVSWRKLIDGLSDGEQNLIRFFIQRANDRFNLDR